MRQTLELHVNGKSHTVNVDPDTPLLYVLRNTLRLNGPKYGCGMQQCGACMVLLNEKAQPSCMLPVSAATTYKITTLEGLATSNGKMHPVQEAFVQEQAAQCGYCLNGMVIASVSLLNQDPTPDDDKINAEMQRCLCRCGAQARVKKAITRVMKKG